MGRKEIDISKEVKATFTQRSFWFPDSLSDIWIEFIKLASKKCKFSKYYPERVSGYSVRRFVLKFVYDNTTNQAIKEKVSAYKSKESEHYDKIVKRCKEKEVQDKLRKQNGRDIPHHNTN